MPKRMSLSCILECEMESSKHSRNKLLLLDPRESVHLSHFRICLRIEFQKNANDVFCELYAILPKNRVNFAVSPRKFRVTSFPVVRQTD